MRLVLNLLLCLLWLALLALQIAIVVLDGGHRVVDILLIAAGLVVGGLLVLIFEWRVFAGLAVGALLSWGAISTIRSGKLSGDSPKLRVREPAAAPLRVGLALSGGGYRAALVHAGVLSGLERLGIPVTNLSTVSGGSIIGAYYAAGGTPRGFAEIVLERRSMNLKRDVLLAQNVWDLVRPRIGRVPFSDEWWGSLDRIDLQASAVDAHLLGGGLTLGALAGRTPRLLVCTTDLRTGALVGLTAEGLVIKAAPGPSGPPEQTFAAWPVLLPMRLSLAVAISGAFPGAFPSRQMVIPTKVGRYRFGLSDGGVADNSGLSLLLAADELAQALPPQPEDADPLEKLRRAHGLAHRSHDPGWRLDAVLASDGGMPLMPFGEGGTLDTVFRMMDVVHAMSQASGKETRGRPFVTFNPREHLFSLTPRPERPGAVPDGQLGMGINFDTSALDRRAIGLLAEVAHPDRKAKMAAAVKGFLAPNDEDGAGRPLRWRLITTNGETKWLLTLGDAKTMLKSESDVQDAAKRLIQLMYEDLRESLQVFQRTSTLEDQIPPADGWALYRLGEYQVLLKAKALQEALETARVNKAGSGLRPLVRTVRPADVGIAVPAPAP